MAGWSNAELRSAVEGYLEMLALETRGTPYSKAAMRRALQKGALKRRSEPSIEYRMRNISAVLAQHSRAIIKGYVPAGNVGSGAAARLWTLIQDVEAHASAGSGLRADPAKGASAGRPAPIVFFNIGWMADYAGLAAEDRTVGGHDYLIDRSHGAEAFNFLATAGGEMEGYRPPGETEQVNITRLGADSKAAWVDGVTVVWLAREPGSGRTLIVGWYRNATVYRQARASGRVVNGEQIFFSASARAADAVLLSPVARTFQVASSNQMPGQGYGQKPTWYGTDGVNHRVAAYIDGLGAKRPARKRPSNPPKNFDPELRRKVERAAVQHATAYFKARYGADCSVESVEAKAKGWDLEVYSGGDPLLVEVKGLLNSALICEVTPNEYAKMMSVELRGRYIVYVVTNALAEPPAVPIAALFRCGDDGVWRTEDGRTLGIEERVAAVLTCL